MKSYANMGIEYKYRGPEPIPVADLPEAKIVLSIGLLAMHQPSVVTAYFLGGDVMFSATLRIGKRPRDRYFNLEDESVKGRLMDKKGKEIVKNWCLENHEMLLKYWKGDIGWKELNSGLRNNEETEPIEFFSQTEAFNSLSPSEQNIFLYDPKHSGYVFRRKIIKRACIVVNEKILNLLAQQ